MEKFNVSGFIDELGSELKASSNTENAAGMSRYMKNRFPFFGLKSTERRSIQRHFLSSLPKDLDRNTRWSIIHKLWEKEEREFQYVAVDWLCTWKKDWLNPEDLPELEKLIITHSWWDTVDLIASNYLGKLAARFPEVKQKMIRDWRNRDNIWLNRSCLIFQLKYGQNTDFGLLKELILQYLPNNEFFIQKAIGWSLRQYSKFEPSIVRDFISSNPLKGVAAREAGKYV